MSVETIKTCDRCGGQSSDKQEVWLCWTPLTFHVSVGMVRMTVTVDLCPRCQDLVFREIDDTRGDSGKPSLLAGFIKERRDQSV